jgi:prepilin-type N-terminal cleavage/methylation domain-containing protein
MLARRGFTLIELLVVVAIIALLMAILLPSLRRAREQGKQTVCLANQKTLALAFVQYANENKDRIARSFTDRHSWTDWPQWENGRYLNDSELQRLKEIEPHKRGIRKGKLFPYARQEAVYHCPSDTRSNPSRAVGAIAYQTYSMLNCMNGDADWEQYVGGTRVTKLISAIHAPGDKLVFVEEADPRGLNMNSWVMWLSKEYWIDPLTVWHHGRSTLGFADGHAIVRRWLDPRTIRMSEMQEFDRPAKDNQDWHYLKKGWTIAPK